MNDDQKAAMPILDHGMNCDALAHSIDGDCTCGLVHRQVIAALEQQLREKSWEIEQLAKWKEAEMQVLGEIDLQEVGKLIGVKLGHPIPPCIVPAIRNLQGELNTLQELVQTYRVGNRNHHGCVVYGYPRWQAHTDLDKRCDLCRRADEALQRASTT